MTSLLLTRHAGSTQGTASAGCSSPTVALSGHNCCYNTEKFQILDGYLPEHPDVCVLRVSVPLLEKS